MNDFTFNNKTSELKAEQLNGIYAELAELLGFDAVHKLFCRYRGCQLSFPVSLFNKAYIHNRILKAYNGSNIRELAAEYGYSEKWIRQLVRRSSAENTAGKGVG